MEDQMNEDMELIRKEFEDYESGKIEADNSKYEQLLDKLINMQIKVEASHKFSDNEEFSEIKTEDIKFLFIRFYQAVVIQKFNEHREAKLEISKKFFEEFFRILRTYNYLSKERVEHYKLISKENEEDKEGEGEVKRVKQNFQALTLNREEKIKNAKYKKDLSDKLSVKFLQFMFLQFKFLK